MIQFRINTPNGIIVSASGALGTINAPCCICGQGQTQSGSYSYVPIESNEANDTDGAPHANVRYTVNWTADVNGYQAALTETADNGIYGYDDTPAITESNVVNADGSWSYRLLSISSLIYPRLFGHLQTDWFAFDIASPTRMGSKYRHRVNKTRVYRWLVVRAVVPPSSSRDRTVGLPSLTIRNLVTFRSSVLSDLPSIGSLMRPDSIRISSLHHSLIRNRHLTSFSILSKTIRRKQTADSLYLVYLVTCYGLMNSSLTLSYIWFDFGNKSFKLVK